jgi:hypothetical protein
MMEAVEKWVTEHPLRVAQSIPEETCIEHEDPMAHDARFWGMDGHLWSDHNGTILKLCLPTKEPFTQREEFEIAFGPISDDKWQWLKEFVERWYVPKELHVELCVSGGVEECRYEEKWTDEVGTIPVCVLHNQNSKHEVTSGKPNPPCLEIDPY